MLVPLLIAGVVGYLLGSLPFGYLVAKAHGVDIFRAGSGNPGATNVKRVLGSAAGNTVYFLDALKGAAATGWPWALAALAYAPPSTGGLWSGLMGAVVGHRSALCLTGLVCAVLGHSFSIFTRFRGGKGVATASGGLLVLMWEPILIGAAVWFITFFASRYVSLASILAAIVVPAAGWALGYPLALKLAATLLGVLVIVRHHSNIRRLLAGTEHRWERAPQKEAP
jgi:acyl phosphate:glycerol-3-phosphate acyltransferase